MRDSTLEEQISNLERFTEEWKKLGDITLSPEKREKISEGELMGMKEELAVLHGSLMVSLEIEETRSLEFLDGLGTDCRGAELRRLQDSWHSSLLFMNEVLGRLKERRRKLANLNRFRVARKAFFSNPFIRLAALVVCIMFLHFIIKTFVIREETSEEKAEIRIERRL